MKKLTLEQISDSFILSCKRFPISIFFLLWFTVSLIYSGLGKSSDAQFFNIFYSQSGKFFKFIFFECFLEFFGQISRVGLASARKPLRITPSRFCLKTTVDRGLVNDNVEWL